MATNPVFNRIDKEAAQYAGFNQAPQQGYGAPQGQPHQGMPAPQGQPQMPMGYPGASESMSPEQLEEMYRQAPAGPAETGRLTLDDVVMKSLGCSPSCWPSPPARGSSLVPSPSWPCRSGWSACSAPWA